MSKEHLSIFSPLDAPLLFKTITITPTSIGSDLILSNLHWIRSHSLQPPLDPISFSPTSSGSDLILSNLHWIRSHSLQPPVDPISFAPTSIGSDLILSNSHITRFAFTAKMQYDPPSNYLFCINLIPLLIHFHLQTPSTLPFRSHLEQTPLVSTN